nr:hypothetical protein [Tanacetum cinerariifolium]
MLSISGSFMVSNNDGQRNRTCGLSLPLSGPDGRVLGRNMAGILVVALLVQADTLQADDSKITMSSSDHVDEVDKEEPYPQEELWPRHLGLACNAVGCVDRKAWTLASPGAGDLHRDPPLGVFYISYSIWCYWHSLWACLDPLQGHAEMLKQWVAMALGLLVIAIVLYFSDAILINKQLYSFSHVCFTARAAEIVFSAFYILIILTHLDNRQLLIKSQPEEVVKPEEMRRKQQQAQQEAYDEDDDMHGGDAQRVQCAQQ